VPFPAPKLSLVAVEEVAEFLPVLGVEGFEDVGVALLEQREQPLELRGVACGERADRLEHPQA
jgi:hypothetical protein